MAFTKTSQSQSVTGCHHCFQMGGWIYKTTQTHKTEIISASYPSLAAIKNDSFNTNDNLTNRSFINPNCSFCLTQRILYIKCNKNKIEKKKKSHKKVIHFLNLTTNPGAALESNCLKTNRKHGTWYRNPVHHFLWLLHEVLHAALLQLHINSHEQCYGHVLMKLWDTFKTHKPIKKEYLKTYTVSVMCSFSCMKCLYFNRKGAGRVGIQCVNAVCMC